MKVIISCYALSCWAQFCSVGCMMFMMLILTDSTLGEKGFFLFFLIPNSWRCGLFAKKCSWMIFGLAKPFCLAIFSLTWYNNTSVVDRKFFLSCWLLKTASYRVCSQTSQLTSVLFIYLKLEVYFLEKNLWQFLIALSFLSELSCNSFFMHGRCRAPHTIKSQLSASMKTNVPISSKPVWCDMWSLNSMEMKWDS